MRAFYYKSGFLIAIFAMVTLLFSISGIAIINHYYSFQKNMDFLSDQYILLKYNADEEKLHTIEQSKQYFKTIKEPYILGYEWVGLNGRALYYTDESLFKVKLISGRRFSKKDFKEHTNTIIISNKLVDRCIKRSGKLSYEFQGDDYDVVGVFQGNSYNASTNVDYYINLESEYLLKKPNWSILIFDSGISSYKNVKQNIIPLMEKDIPLESVNFAKEGSKEAEAFKSTYSDVKFMLILIFIAIIMVFLNIFSATQNWLTGKKKEISIRRMLGATKMQLYIWLVIHYIKLVLISSILGASLTKIFITFIQSMPNYQSIKFFIGTKISFLGMFMAFIIVMIIGVITIISALKKQNKKSIVENVRC